jgi:hypothetical protein
MTKQSFDVKNVWRHTTVPPHVFEAGFLIKRTEFTVKCPRPIWNPRTHLIRTKGLHKDSKERRVKLTSASRWRSYSG